MQQCPDCGKIYDESEYTHCPYCSGEISRGGRGNFEVQLLWYDKLERRKRWVSESEYNEEPDRYEEP